MNMAPDMEKTRNDLLDCFQHALQAVNGRECVKAYFRQNKPLEGSFALVAIGKAALAMTDGAVDVFAGQIERGLVICKAGFMDGGCAHWPNINVIESAHPVPDERSLAAGQWLVEFISSLPDDMPVLFLISGGASALVEVLPAGMGLEELQKINTSMLASGMTIVEMNRVRKAISQIKGGRLLNYVGKRPVINLLLSDVPGDDPAVIGSGLLIKSSESQELPGNLPRALHELVKNSDEPRLVQPTDVNIQTRIIGSNRLAREAAANRAKQLGYPVRIHEEFLNSDVVELAENIIQQLEAGEAGIHIWGAEATVNLPDNPGRGGRNQHLALLLAERIQKSSNLQILVAATDGDDGVTEDAGAIVDGQTIRRGEQEGMNAMQCITRADAGSFLESSGDLVYTGPTGTNVMDLIIVCKT